MKTKTLTIPTGNIVDPVLEDMLRKRDAELKVLVEKNSKNFAQRNLPAIVGDNLLTYIGEIKAGYEKLAADVFHYLQPEAHFPEAKVDAEYFREKAIAIETEIHELEALNQRDQNELNEFEQTSIPSRIIWAIASTLLITLGEVMFNTKAFQVTGETLLFAFGLSLCISFAVFLFSHIAPILIKVTKTKIQRIVIITGAFLLVTSLFISLAIFRSSYLATHDIHIEPSYFVIINLFFFIVSSLVSFFILPTWEEIKKNGRMIKLQYAIKKRKIRIIKLKAEVDQINITVMERTKIRLRIAHFTNYAVDRIRKMYFESLGIFKTTNLLSRKDNAVPDCFTYEVPLPEIDSFFYSLKSITKS